MSQSVSQGMSQSPSALQSGGASPLADASAPAFGVYLHWPFCASKCPYCDFNSHVRDAVDTAAWQEALCAELEDAAAHLWANPPDAPRQVASVFFGGGTPSLMPPECVAAILEKVQALWQSLDAIEITLECNPSDLDEARCRGLRDAGVNRLSIGVQSFDDAVLSFLGRRHDGAQARAALTAACKTFPRVSLDMIYAHPEQSVRAWREDLHQGLAFATEHLSAYQLTLEPNTPFYAQARRGVFSVPGEDAALALWNETQEATMRAGLVRYETSNHARGGVAGASRHNLEIWRGGDYAAIGPGAHGRTTIETSAHGRTAIETSAHGRTTIETSAHGRTTIETSAHGRTTTETSAHGRTTMEKRRQNAVQDKKRIAVSRIASPERWLALRSTGKDTLSEEQLLSADEIRDEIFLNGLRLSTGVSRARLTRETGYQDFQQALPADRLTSLVESGLLVLDETGLRTTEAGAVRLNAILGYLLALPAGDKKRAQEEQAQEVQGV